MTAVDTKTSSLKMIGSYSYAQTEKGGFNFYFKIKENFRYVYMNLYDLSENGLLFMINDNISVIGECEILDYKRTFPGLLIHILLDPKAPGFLELAKQKGETISLTIKINPKANRTQKFATSSFIAKCGAQIGRIASYVGTSPEEMTMAIEDSFYESTGTKFRLVDPGVYHDLDETNAFYLFIRKFATMNGIEIESIPDMISGVDEYLYNRRKDNICCICNNPKKKEVGLLPLCSDHLNEFNELKEKHPKSYEAKFKKKHKLQEG